MSDIIHHMRTKAPALVPLFRSPLQARLLLLVLTSDEGMTAAQLARALHEPEPTVSREARRLMEAGLLRGEKIGRATRLHAALDNPATYPLRQLLVVTYGPSRLLEQALTGIDDIDEAYIHGSWAARYHGEPGKAPGDIDVLVIGTADRGAVDEAVDGIESQIGREVNITYVTPQRWADAQDPFLRAVRERPLVALDLNSGEQS
jgi:DNA-binding transcriptional ArsR family regulator